ncbi:iron uptake system protein EfeO [Pseudomonas sp. CCI3.2]|uniref:iron uptake system protein EfeO n=1 Tax=unclassified Pseudomonas TaxID=196821 RepID=UPI002AC93B73|nr:MULTISPECIES: iron uptake system protein EfeO [unclassified Pseudomonas]MEB0077474.1 iron uptake system protein EfeO [Pseudomonas sp. MH10out]MEB0104435.1 iron uptake system protein EfeO [Pseudomonas sp. CCI3.2]MEB0133272.1 iron uptake system protein EfeO [Pseudomonas sp. CCI2.4]MEB0160440.1 iron uptake system protein EfeO [Pseudomonas sp. AH2 (2023)]MEB0167886.1 iron uptake system protein EfeO [Pseudomonas sp. CCC4.4]
MTKSPLALMLTLGLLQTPFVFAATAPLDLVGPVSDYKIYVTEQLDTLGTDTQKFTDAIKKGDLTTAKKLYPTTRVSYESIEPIAELFDDLDKSIDSRVDDHADNVDAPDFTGFHRLEYTLFAKNTTDGLGDLAEKLNNDVKELQTRVAGLTFPPEKVVGGAAALMEEVAKTKLSGEEDRYSHTDLYDFEGNINGAKKIVDLFHPQIEQQDKAFAAKVDKNFAAVNKILVKYKTKDGGYETYDKVSAKDRKAMVGPVNTLAEDLSTLRGKLGLN